MAARSWGLAMLGHRLAVLSACSRSVPAAAAAASQSIFQRWCSGPSWEDSADGEMDMSPSRRLEQALQEIRIQKAAPDWLPLFPGGSFWIHPDQISKAEPSKPYGPLLEPACEREVFAMVMPMGWPSSSAAEDGKSPVIEVVDPLASSHGPTSEEESLALLVPTGWPELSAALEALSPEPESGG